AAAAAPSEELHPLRDDLGDVPPVAVLVVVLAGADGALDVHLAPLGEVLAARLALLAPHDDVVPLGALLALPFLVVPHLAGRDREARHRASIRREAHLRILSEVPDQQDRKSTRLNSSHRTISYAVFCLKKKNKN